MRRLARRAREEGLDKELPVVAELVDSARLLLAGDALERVT